MSDPHRQGAAEPCDIRPDEAEACALEEKFDPEMRFRELGKFAAGLAARMGFGQLFSDAATSIAGRYAGGPAKVAALASAMMGTITGPSIANAVTTCALTIPAMVRVGYQRHFAAASTGGQITLPIMGAAAFLMIEFLGIPYTHIMIAALVPAFTHFFGVLMNGHMPHLAAFSGVTFCIIIGLVNPRNRMTIGDVFAAFVVDAKYALAVGAAAAPVGIIIGVFTPTAVSFRDAFIVTRTAGDWPDRCLSGSPSGS